MSPPLTLELRRLSDLPPLPVVIQEVIASFADENISVHQLANKIGKDQALVAKILRVANSPFYGLMRHVASLQEALVVLGFGVVRSLTLAAGIMAAIPHAPGGLDRAQFWRHGMRVALLARILAKRVGRDYESAFTAGFLHDLGELALDWLHPVEYRTLLAEAQGCGERQVWLEREGFCLDHAAVGGEIARLWNFPVDIQLAVRNHIDPEQEPHSIIADVVCAAEYIVGLHEIGLASVEIHGLLPDVLLTRLPLLNDALLDELLEGAQAGPFYADLMLG